MSENEEIIAKILSDKSLLARIKEEINKINIQDLKSNEDLIEYWIYGKAYSKLVCKNYRLKMRYFLNYLQTEIDNRDWNLQDVTIAEIESYKTYLEKNNELGIKTKELYYGIVESFYDFYQKKARSVNIWHFKEFPYFNRLNLNPGEIDIENREKKIAILNPEEAKIYLKRIFRIDKIFYLTERLQFESGLRFIDVKRIKTKFLRLNQRHLYTQGRRGFRCYFLSEELKQHLLEYANFYHELLFFSNTEMNYESYLNKIKRMIKKVGLSKNLSTRSGRKSFTTNRYERMNQPDPDISLLLGHQVKTVTDRYKILKPEFFLKKFDDFNYLKTIF